MFCRKNKNTFLYHQQCWFTNITDNEHSAGISLYCELINFTYEYDNNSIFILWEEKKDKFWNIIEKVFLKYFKRKYIIKIYYTDKLFIQININTTK